MSGSQPRRILSNLPPKPTQTRDSSKLWICVPNFLGDNTNNSRFYYSDERKADGRPAYSAIDGEAHAELYLQLAESKSQGPWQQTFVKGVGYKKF